MRTHCKRGHLFDEANTYIGPKGKRRCRACAKKSRKKWQEANPFVRTEQTLERDRIYREKNRELIRARNRKTDGIVAKHHLEERHKITAWLRSLDQNGSGEINRFLPTTLANWIEEGMHNL